MRAVVLPMSVTVTNTRICTQPEDASQRGAASAAATATNQPFDLSTRLAPVYFPPPPSPFHPRSLLTVFVVLPTPELTLHLY